MNYECNGRRAVISGGTSGIGLAAARTLLADGAEVWLLARTERPQLLTELKENYGEKVHFIKCDVAKCCQLQSCGGADQKMPAALNFFGKQCRHLPRAEHGNADGNRV